MNDLIIRKIKQTINIKKGSVTEPFLVLLLFQYISDFCIPVLSVLLAKMGILTADFMRTYRRHAIIVIMLIAAIITPPDIFTLLLVSIPMYLLYEASIWLVSRTQLI